MFGCSVSVPLESVVRRLIVDVYRYCSTKCKDEHSKVHQRVCKKALRVNRMNILRKNTIKELRGKQMVGTSDE